MGGPSASDSGYIPQSFQEPLVIEQSEFNDLVHNQSMKEQQVDHLGSRLQQWHFLTESMMIPIFRKRNQKLVRRIPFVYIKTYVD